MSPEEMKLDMLVAELDYENRLLRARNERLTTENERMADQIKELQSRLAQPQANGEH
jgi:chaperonin cofactor prefoldin